MHSQSNFFGNCLHRQPQKYDSQMFVNIVRLTITQESSWVRCHSNTISKHPRIVSYAHKSFPMFVCWGNSEIHCLLISQSGTCTWFFPSILYPGHKMSELQSGVGDACLKSQHWVEVGGAGEQGSL